MPPPKLSIVTVVKDDELGFMRTLESLQQQNLHAVEWVIIDSSRIPIEQQAIAEKVPAPIKYRWVDPRGVYPAMNTGLEHAAGEYVWFINAGDLVASGATVQGLVATLAAHQPEWLVGEVIFARSDGSVTRPPPFDYETEKRRSFARGRFPPHQGTVVRRELLKSMKGFNTRYRIAADYHTALRLSETADPLVTPEPLAVFNLGGISTERWREGLHEFRAARSEVLSLGGYQKLVETVDSYSLLVRMYVARVLNRA